VTRRFEAQGVAVHDADLVAREVVEPGTPGLAEVAARFGDSVLAADGSLDRRAMRERVFADPEARLALEAIIHPRVREVLRERAGGGSGRARAAVGAHRMRDRESGTSAGDRGVPRVAHAMRSYTEGRGESLAGYVVVAVPLLAESSGDWGWL